MRKIGVFTVVVVSLLFAVMPVVLAATEEEIGVAIDDGVTWLVGQQYWDGHWGAYDCERVGGTGFAVVILADRAFKLGYDSPFDPTYQYSENIKDGLDYIFANTYTMPISVQPAGNPDTNGNGIGVYFRSPAWDKTTYETGIAMMAIAASRDPDRTVNVPGSPVNGWKYRDVLQDAVDYFAFGQNDYPPGQGGWHYKENHCHPDDLWSGSDNSCSGYAVLGLRYAESYGFDCTVPQFVKDELSIWIDYIQNDVDGDTHDGGSGYDNPDDYPGRSVNILKTGNLLFEMEFVGDTLTTSRVQDAIGYIERHWDDANEDPGWRGCPGQPAHKQAMCCAMKGLEAFAIDTITVGGVDVDWFNEFADALLTQQYDDGSWGPAYWGGQPLGTEWALLTLEKVVPPLEVVIDIKPGSYPNSINLGSQGVIPVAILSSADFDATQVDPSTVTLAGAGVAIKGKGNKSLSHLEDVSGDDLPDLVVQIETENLNPAEFQGGYAYLTGKTYGGRSIEGSDEIIIVPPEAAPAGSIESEGLAVFPQPANPDVWIPYKLGQDSEVTITIRSASGQLIRTLDLGDRPAGFYTTKERSAYWDGKNEAGEQVSSGVYFYTIQAGAFTATKKMIMAK